MDPTPASSSKALALTVLDRPIVVDRRCDSWLRVFQSCAGREGSLVFRASLYCWNDDCHNCEFELQDAEQGLSRRVRGCLTRPRGGQRALTLPTGVSER